ncbi:RraA family protein [Xylanibacillus composti]|uniref:Putative 4-hydroxy-4-methyl-2-oxoglutarate aldolase n=1 Tax=Xylanibacillus composti TaxID=1572762 RepID=A0A8J4GYK9_9BACL|nr:RraA family protein [Xylanibacillus composti]MDT9725772.1 RraA family protein [Xylanibacillus composti]GIQ67514.1 hypothetical protein XYCOK13_03380 [Xylanibacillus composti]
MTTINKKEIMDIYKQLRVADVRDGMDWMMMHNYGSVSPDIVPLFRTRFCGFARTVRYVPTNRPIPKMTPDEYTEFVGHWYNSIATYGWQNDIEEDDVIMMDASNTNVGIIGSHNSLDWKSRGARGIVTNGGCRDTDEVILTEVPVYSRYRSQTMVQGRIEFQAANIPVDIGGVLVRPGDVVVADYDGVIVVPIEKAMDVAKYAMKELQQDKINRREVYEKMGMELDDTVQ